MTQVALPAAGIRIQHDPLDPKHVPQIIRLNLTDNITRDLLHDLKEDIQARVKLGKRPTITFGTRNVPVHHGTDKFPVELFAGPLDGSEPTYFAGRLSHTLEVQQAKEATAGMDQALANLKQNLKASLEDRAAGGAGLMGNKLLNAHRPSALAGGFLSSRPSSPFLGGLSPRAAPTSAPLQSGVSMKDKILLDAIKIPLIHLLAVEPCSADTLARKLRAKRSDCDKVLEKVARDSKGGKKELKDRAYRDLDVWKFRYETQHDRQRAIEHAVSAFDRMRVEKTDQLWQMLLAKEDRGKGIQLSRLNFDKPLATGNLTPKIPERSTDGSVEGKSTASDQSFKKATTTASKTSDDMPKAKATAGTKTKTASKDTSKDYIKIGIPAKDSIKVKAGKQDSKYKSSERIENSDDEASTIKPLSTSKQPAPIKQPLIVKSTKTERPAPTSKAPTHKSQLSASSVGGSDVDNGRLTPSTVISRKRPATEAPEGKDRAAPRARNGSSPAKPSPLGSSPPTNSRDIDSTSNSSRATNQSSAPSSPPSSAELVNSKKNYSPVITERKVDQLTNGIKKRKADTDHDLHPAKRQNVSKPVKTGNDRTHSVSRVNGDTAKGSKNGSPDSTTSSNSDASVTRDSVEDNAKQFKKFWNTYRDLHDKLEKQDESRRDPEDVRTLWKMHTRLKNMKDQIWKDWEKLEKLQPR